MFKSDKFNLMIIFTRNNTLLHNRACKYNLSALGTYFECEGDFTWTSLGDHGNVVRSKKPKCAVKYDLRHTGEHIWPIENRSQPKSDVQRHYNSDKRTDKQINSISFSERASPFHILSFNTKWSSTNYKPATVSSFKQVISIGIHVSASLSSTAI